MTNKMFVMHSFLWQLFFVIYYLFSYSVSTNNFTHLDYWNSKLYKILWMKYCVYIHHFKKIKIKKRITYNIWVLITIIYKLISNKKYNRNIFWINGSRILILIQYGKKYCRLKLNQFNNCVKFENSYSFICVIFISNN